MDFVAEIFKVTFSITFNLRLGGIAIIALLWLGGAVVEYLIDRIFWSIFGEQVRQKGSAARMTKVVDFLMAGSCCAMMLCFLCFLCFLVEGERNQKAAWQVMLLKTYFGAMIAVGLLSAVVELLRRVVKWRSR